MVHGAEPELVKTRSTNLVPAAPWPLARLIFRLAALHRPSVAGAGAGEAVGGAGAADVVGGNADIDGSADTPGTELGGGVDSIEGICGVASGVGVPLHAVSTSRLPTATMPIFRTFMTIASRVSSSGCPLSGRTETCPGCVRSSRPQSSQSSRPQRAAAVHRGRSEERRV